MDHDDRARNLEHLGAALEDFRFATAGLPDGDAIAFDFLSSARSFEGDQSTLGTHEREAPVREPGQGSDRPGGDDIRATELLTYLPLLRAPADNGDGEFQLLGNLGQPVDPAGHRFEQNDIEVRSADRERYTRKPRARADVDHAGAVGDPLTDHGGVEDVALPQPVNLAGSDEPALDAVPLQEFDVADGLLDAVSEYFRRRTPYRCGDPVQAQLSLLNLDAVSRETRSTDCP